MLSSLDITRILAEGAGAILGGTVVDIAWYRKERHLQVFVKADRRYCLGLSYHPRGDGFYILPSGRTGIDTVEKPRPFARQLWDGTLAAIRQLPNDRIIILHISRGEATRQLVLEILGGNANVLHLDAGGHLVESMRRKTLSAGEAYQPPALLRKFDPDRITPEIIAELLAGGPEINLARLLEKQLYGFDYHMAQTALAEGNDPETIHKNIIRLCAGYTAAKGPVFAYPIRGHWRFYPFRLAGLEPLFQSASMSEAAHESISRSRSEDIADTFQEQTVSAIAGKLEKVRRAIRNLEADLAEASDYERNRQYADLLKINLGKISRGLASVTVDNLYGDEQPVEIPLDPRLNGPENIQHYARKFRKGKDGLAILQRRLDNTVAEKKFLEQVLADFEKDFDQARQNYPELLPPITAGRPAEQPPRRPYKEYVTSTGLTVLVGRTGDDNDRTTFEYGRPHDLWFHVSQCPGSHVVLKVPHQNFQPSRQEIEEAAAAAAWASKARHSAKVPVSYTLRKYVRKGRQAKAGLVHIEREKTILVAPRELAAKSE